MASITAHLVEKGMGVGELKRLSGRMTICAGLGPLGRAGLVSVEQNVPNAAARSS